MKVGILTFHGADNYGAVLQAYALIEWLRQNHIDAEIIDYRSKVYDKYRLFRTGSYKKAPYLIGVDMIKFFSKLKRNTNFDAFRSDHLNISSEKYHTLRELHAANSKYDFFICGSDQIWNPELTKGIDRVYFLDFVSKPNKKISFSPSIALKSIPEAQIAEMTGYMESFSALSIREQKSIDLLQPFCSKSITRTCDPVFLPDKSCYRNLFSDSVKKNSYIFLYIIGRAAAYSNIISFAEKKAHDAGLDLYYLVDGDKLLYRIKGRNMFGCKPSLFLELIDNAAFIISNSFHATAFSILFEKQFISFLKENTGSRIANLLRELEIEDRIYDTKDDVLTRNIDYTNVSGRLAILKETSENYLMNALGLV